MLPVSKRKQVTARAAALQAGATGAQKQVKRVRSSPKNVYTAVADLTLQFQLKFCTLACPTVPESGYTLYAGQLAPRRL